MAIIYTALAFIGILTGILAGLFGFGGGFVVVPLVYHLFPKFGLLTPADQHFAMQLGVATSTAVMIIGTAYSAFKHHRAGNIDWKHVLPLGYYIALGAAVGAYAASIMPGVALRITFAIYIGAVIADCLLRKGFVEEQTSVGLRPMSTPVEVVAGTIIGTIASLLGVGGSVMTVPLMRRRGAPMRKAVALANPLSFPVAIVGSLTYVLAAEANGIRLGPGYLGFIYLPGFVILSAFSILGVEVAIRVLPKVPDKVHAFVYIGLLAVVLAAMVL
jgi:uncharacterized protein